MNLKYFTENYSHIKNVLNKKTHLIKSIKKICFKTNMFATFIWFTIPASSTLFSWWFLAHYLSVLENYPVSSMLIGAFIGLSSIFGSFLFKEKKRINLFKEKHQVINLLIQENLELGKISTCKAVEKEINTNLTKIEQDIYIKIHNFYCVNYNKYVAKFEKFEGEKEEVRAARYSKYKSKFNFDLYDILCFVIDNSTNEEIKKYKNSILNIIKENFTQEEKINITEKIKSEFVKEEQNLNHSIEEIEVLLTDKKIIHKNILNI
jgi:hypothetical protein